MHSQITQLPIRHVLCRAHCVVFSLLVGACTAVMEPGPGGPKSSQPIADEVVNFATPLANGLTPLITRGMQRAESSRTSFSPTSGHLDFARVGEIRKAIEEQLGRGGELAQALGGYVRRAPFAVPMEGKGVNDDIYWKEARDVFTGDAKRGESGFAGGSKYDFEVRVAHLKGHPVATELVDVIFKGVGRLGLAFRAMVDVRARSDSKTPYSVSTRDWATLEFLGEMGHKTGQWPKLRIRGCAAALACAAGTATIDVPHGFTLPTLLDVGRFHETYDPDSRSPFLWVIGPTSEGGTEKSLALSAALTYAKGADVVHPNWSLAGVKAFVRYHPQLLEVEIEAGAFDRGVLLPDGQFPKLGGLEIAKLPLRALVLQKIAVPRGELAHMVPGLDALEVLVLSGVGLTDVDASALSNLPNPEKLITLRLGHNPNLTNATVRVVARHFPNLQVLSLYANQRLAIDNKGLAVIAENLRELETLSISNTQVTPGGLGQSITPENFPKLQELWADDLPVELTREQRDAIRAQFPLNDRGEKLDINGSNLTEEMEEMRKN